MRFLNEDKTAYDVFYNFDKSPDETWQQMADRTGFTKKYLKDFPNKKNSNIGDIYRKRRQTWLEQKCKDAKTIENAIQSYNDDIDFYYLTQDDYSNSDIDADIRETIEDLKKDNEKLKHELRYLSRIHNKKLNFDDPSNSGKKEKHVPVYKTEKTVCPKTKKELQNLIVSRIDKYGYQCDLNDIDTHLIEDMSGLFDLFGITYSMSYQYRFNGKIDEWDVSNVKDMSGMLSGCQRFNQPLNNWDVSNVTNMDNMFSGCFVFNQPLDNWDVSNVTSMQSMFDNCVQFNQSLNDWDVSNVKNMSHMFHSCKKFNSPLNKWDVYNVENMQSLFDFCESFNQPLTDWIVGDNLKDCRRIYAGCGSLLASNAFEISEYSHKQILADYEAMVKQLRQDTDKLKSRVDSIDKTIEEEKKRRERELAYQRAEEEKERRKQEEWKEYCAKHDLSDDEVDDIVHSSGFEVARQAMMKWERNRQEKYREIFGKKVEFMHPYKWTKPGNGTW